MDDDTLADVSAIMCAALALAARLIHPGDQGSLQWFYDPNPPLEAGNA